MGDRLSGAEYRTIFDHRKIIKAQLTGEPIPLDVRAKADNPLFTPAEEEFETMEAKKELTEEGYRENKNGVWVRFN